MPALLKHFVAVLLAGAARCLLTRAVICSWSLLPKQLPLLQQLNHCSNTASFCAWLSSFCARKRQAEPLGNSPDTRPGHRQSRWRFSHGITTQTPQGGTLLISVLTQQTFFFPFLLSIWKKKS